MNQPSVVDSILSARYLRRGEKDFTDICRRVASALAEDETERARFHEAMISLRFLPNSPTLMNAGTELGRLRLLHPSGPGHHRWDFRRDEGRGDHPQNRWGNR